MTAPAYNIVISEQTLKSLESYQADLIAGKEVPGDRLKKELAKHSLTEMTTENFLESLLATKPPRIFAENEIRADGRDWNRRELALLGDINVSMAVKIFDNGVWSLKNPDFKQHSTPIEGHLLFTPGALLNVGPHFKGQSPDMVEITTNGKIDQQKYNQLIERRMLPLFAEINETAKKTGKPALVTLPGIGCGAFAGKFRGTMGAHLNAALQALLEKHGSKLSHIKSIYFDSFNECGNEQRNIHGIQYRVRPAVQNPGKPQLAAPQTYQEAGDDFSNCTLHKIVAWDHASLPGNDFFANDRVTDDGVSAAATNSMEKVTGLQGQYVSGKYYPPQGYKNWEDAALKNGVHLLARGNVNVAMADGTYRTLETQQPAPGLKNLSDDVRGFLYTFFNDAATSFKDSLRQIEPGLMEVVTPPPGSLASTFQQVAWAARGRGLQEVNAALNTVIEKVNATTDPDLQDQIEGARLQQQLYYRGRVRNNAQLQADLGSFAKGIF